MKVREVLKLLNKDGWTVKEAKGSHSQLTHPTKSGKVTLPNHKGDIPPCTLNSIWRQAGLK
jgi:predicted RNA binding protein YcfA (HicA-like mRNA interferase family)